MTPARPGLTVPISVAALRRGRSPRAPRAPEELGFVDDFNTQRAGLVELAARVRARHQRIGLLAHAPGYPPAGGLDQGRRVAPGEGRKGAGQHEALPGTWGIARRGRRFREGEPGLPETLQQPEIDRLLEEACHRGSNRRPDPGDIPDLLLGSRLERIRSE